MKDELNKLQDKFFNSVKNIQGSKDLERLETKIFGRKNGELTLILKGLKDLEVNERKEAGMLANEVKWQIKKALQIKRLELNSADINEALRKEKVDVTQPSLPPLRRGHWHPNSIIQKDLEDLFLSMGFMILDGPELESDYYNFTALNIPETHPARDMQDTFYIKGHSADSVKALSAAWVMRTHTSPMQVRAMQKYGAPIRAVVPGKCFRNEATDPRHEHTFYQLEGLVVDKNITFAHMKGIFQKVADHLYGEGTQVRLMPKYYPFVEPGVRGEIACFLCVGKGCRVCKNSGWLEVMPGGMVHPNVLKEGNIDPQVYQGFAFGFGLTRLAMLKYGIEDIRLMEGGDLRFLEQF